MLLGIQPGSSGFRLQDFHLLWCSILLLGLTFPVPGGCPTTLSTAVESLGCSPFARRYWGNRSCFLFLRLLRYFSSPGSLALVYGFNEPC